MKIESKRLTTVHFFHLYCIMLGRKATSCECYQLRSERRNTWINELVREQLSCLDDDSDWIAEDCSSFAVGESCEEARPLLGIRCCLSSSPHVHFCHDCALARLHLVCHRQCGKTHSAGNTLPSPNSTFYYFTKCSTIVALGFFVFFSKMRDLNLYTFLLTDALYIRYVNRT